MSHSGDSYVYIEENGRALPYAGQDLELSDGDPYVFFAVSGQNSVRVCKSGSHGTVRRAPQSEMDRLTSLAPHLSWWSWSPWGDPSEFARDRRIGLFVLRLEAPIQITIRAFMHSGRLLSAAQGMQILHTISQQFPGAIWSELGPTAEGLARPLARIDPRMRSPRHQAASLLKDVELELRAASAAVAVPRWEIAPCRHLSHQPVPGQANRYRDYDIPENRVVVAWARMRQNQIQAILRQLEAGMERLVAAFGEDLRLMRERCAASGRDREPESDLLDDAARLPVLRDLLLAQRPALDRIIRSLVNRNVGGAWSMTPAIRRNPCLALLARAQARPFLDESCSELRDLGLALLPLRTTSRLYELWAALALAKVLEELGFRQDVPIRINGQGIHEGLFELPHRIEWTLSRGNTRLHWSFAPAVTTLDGSLHPNLDRLLLTKQQRALYHAQARQMADTYVTCLKTNSPDYILRVERQGRTAFAVGDAVFGDPNHPSGIAKKLGKVASEYANNIFYVDGGNFPWACSLGCSFVLVPSAVEDLGVRKVATERQVVLLPFAPELDGRPSDAAVQCVGQVVDTLAWLCEQPNVRADET